MRHANPTEARRQRIELKVDRHIGDMLANARRRQQRAGEHRQRLAQLNAFQAANAEGIVLSDDMSTLRRRAAFLVKPWLAVFFETYVGFELMRAFLADGFNIRVVDGSRILPIPFAFLLLITLLLAAGLMHAALRMVAASTHEERWHGRAARLITAACLLLVIPVLSFMTYGKDFFDADGLKSLPELMGLSKWLFVAATLVILMLNYQILTEAAHWGVIEDDRVLRKHLKRLQRAARRSDAAFRRLEEKHHELFGQLHAMAMPLRGLWADMTEDERRSAICFVHPDRRFILNVRVFKADVLPTEPEVVHAPGAGYAEELGLFDSNLRSNGESQIDLDTEQATSAHSTPGAADAGAAQANIPGPEPDLNDANSDAPFAMHVPASEQQAL